MTTDGILQQGAFGDEHPTWFTNYLDSLTIKKEEVQAAELDKVLEQYQDVSKVFRANVTTAYKAETRLEAARKAEEESLTQQLKNNPVSYDAPYPDFPWEHLQRDCKVLNCFRCNGPHKTTNCKLPRSKLTCSKCNLKNHTTEAHRQLPGRSTPRAETGEEIGVFTCFSSATSFVDGGISLKNEGKPFFVNSKLLVDTGVLMPSGITISEDFFFQGMGGTVEG